jgi:hypothetical protein
MKPLRVYPQCPVPFNQLPRWLGDGRIKIHPLPCDITPGTRPIAITRSTARMLIEDFTRDGFSNHSGSGSTLWLIIEHCRITRTPYQITGSPGEFWYGQVHK